MKAELTTDIKLITSMVTAVWDEIAEDELKSGLFQPNFYRRTYLCVFDDHGEPLGVLSMHVESTQMIHVHIHIPHGSREEKYEIGQAMIDWIWGETPFTSIIAYVPVIFPNVIGFANRLGFINVGTLSRGHKKDGELHDLQVLQLERGEDNG